MTGSTRDLKFATLCSRKTATNWFPHTVTLWTKSWFGSTRVWKKSRLLRVILIESYTWRCHRMAKLLLLVLVMKPFVSGAFGLPVSKKVKPKRAKVLLTIGNSDEEKLLLWLLLNIIILYTIFYGPFLVLVLFSFLQSAFTHRVCL